MRNYDNFDDDYTDDEGWKKTGKPTTKAGKKKVQKPKTTKGTKKKEEEQNNLYFLRSR